MPSTSEHDNDTADHQPALRLVLPAGWGAPSVARTRLRDWLEAHRWPDDDVDDLVLAVSEAVTNSVEHGCGMATADVAPRSGLVELTACLKCSARGARHVELAVRDFGEWRAPVRGPTVRGYGLVLIRAVAMAVEVHRLPDGTLVRIVSRPVSARPGPRT